MAEVHLQQPPGPTTNADESDVQDLSEIQRRRQAAAIRRQRDAGRRLDSNIMAAIRQCTATAGPNSASTTAAAPAGMPLLLTGFSADVDEFLHPSVWKGLPLAAPALTRLEMNFQKIPWRADVPAALQQLPDLKHFKLTRPGDCDSDEYRSRSDVFQHVTVLSCLTRLTSLEIWPLVSGDLSSLPTSVVDLRLRVAKLTEAAARRLALPKLPLLQCCELQHLPRARGGGFNYDAAVSLQLAAPQLTRLALNGPFRDVLGLQDCSSLQQLWLKGCVVSVPGLIRLVSQAPSLLDFSWDGWEDAVNSGWNLAWPVLKVPSEQQEQLVAALSAATQLTALSVSGLHVQGVVDSIPEVASSGAVHRAEDIDSSSTLDSHHLPWGQHLQGLPRLQRLDLVPLYGLRAADVLDRQLTA